MIFSHCFWPVTLQRYHSVPGDVKRQCCFGGKLTYRRAVYSRLNALKNNIRAVRPYPYISQSFNTCFSGYCKENSKKELWLLHSGTWVTARPNFICGIAHWAREISVGFGRNFSSVGVEIRGGKECSLSFLSILSRVSFLSRLTL